MQDNHIRRTLDDSHHLSVASSMSHVDHDWNEIHFEFCTFDTRLRFASEPISLFTPPLLMPDIWAIRTVGTTSWFFEPIST